MKRLFTKATIGLILLLAVSTIGAVSQNLNKKLKGDYRFTTSLHCVSVDGPSGGFDTLLRPLLPVGTEAYHRNMSSVGVRSFDGDGFSSLTAEVIITYLDRTTFEDGGSVAVITLDCPDGNYEVFADGSFTQNYGPCTGAIVEPPLGPSTTFPVDYISTAGQIGNAGNTLLIFDTGIDIQQSGSAPVTSICGRSGSAVRL